MRSRPERPDRIDKFGFGDRPPRVRRVEPQGKPADAPTKEQEPDRAGEWVHLVEVLKDICEHIGGYGDATVLVSFHGGRPRTVDLISTRQRYRLQDRRAADDDNGEKGL